MPKLRVIPPVNVELVLDGTEIKSCLHDDLRVGEEDITQHLDEVSSRIAYWGMLKAKSNHMYSTYKNNLKVWIAEKKQAVQNSGGKYTSETAKEDAVLLANALEYGQKIKEIIDIEYIREILDVCKDAFIAKKDMLISLAAQLRQEFGAMEAHLNKKDWNENLNKGNHNG